MSKLFKPFIIIHLHVFLIYGAAPAEARYKISGVRKAGVAVLRSFFNTTRLSTACVDNELMFTLDLGSWISVAANIEKRIPHANTTFRWIAKVHICMGTEFILERFVHLLTCSRLMIQTFNGVQP